MRKYVTWTLALAIAVAVGVAGIAVAGGEKPVVVRAGNLILTINGGVTPTALPRHKYAPVKLKASGKIATADGTHPPALKEVILDTDKNGTINVKGIKVCKKGALLSRDTRSAEKACPKSIIGKGTTDVQIAFPEQAPIPANSKLLVFNGGFKGGTTTLYIHAYLSQPTPAAIVTTVKIKKEHKGRYGLRSVASVPLIVNGNGSVTSFSLLITKALSAKCADGHFNAQAEAVFRDGSKLKGTLVRTCKPKG